MKKICVILFSIFCVGTALANNIAVVDLEYIMQNSVAFKRLNDSLEKEKKSYQEKIKQKEIELTTKRDKLQSQASLLSQECLQQKTNEFQKELLSFQEEVKNKENELQKKLMDGLAVLNNEVKTIVNDIVKEDKYNKYTSVLSTSIMLYYRDDDNITTEVLKRLNKKNISLINIDNKKKK